jgi:DNA-binding MarR family transcriptional regulator
MQDELLASHLCTALMRIGTRMATVFDQHFDTYGITQAQFRVLLAIWDYGGVDGMAPSMLADRLLIERATISVLTARLVTWGWLERVPGENRRTFRLTLTETGWAKLREVLPHAVVLADETINGFDREELRAALTLLEKLEARLRERK